MGLLRASTVISAAAEALPDVPDISSRTGRSSRGAELRKYAQKVESFPSEPPKVLADIAVAPRLQPLFRSSQLQWEHFCKDLMRMLRTDATFLYEDGLRSEHSKPFPG